MVGLDHLGAARAFGTKGGASSVHATFSWINDERGPIYPNRCSIYDDLGSSHGDRNSPNADHRSLYAARRSSYADRS